jgi:hypothetical protein
VNEDEVNLEGGGSTKVTRAGDVVYRSPKPQSRTVISFLTFLNTAGFKASPRPVGSGFAPDGREMLTYIEGSSPQPFAWSDEAVFDVGALLRQLHSLSAIWQAPSGAQWRDSFLRGLRGNASVIGHGDLGPWNILARDGKPVAFIDWDNAGPLDPLWELAHVVWQNAQLYDDDVMDLNELPDAESRFRQAKLIADGYGLGREARHDFVDRMIELAIRSAREEAIDYHVTPDTNSPAPDGFPILWAVTWRSRSAVWMIDHREHLQRTIEGH